jgi:hypothetical protein
VLLIWLAAALSGCGGNQGVPASQPKAAAAEAVSQQPSAGCPPDATGRKVRIVHVRKEDDREVMSVDPDPQLGGEASVMWRGDLNGDGRPDLILRFFELCGNAGECPWGVYAGCGQDESISVWGPEYTFRIDSPAESGKGWAPLMQTIRVAKVGRDDAEKRKLLFQNGAYRSANDTKAAPR